MATPVSNSIPLTGNPLIDGLTQGSSWQFGAGPRVITYSLSVNDTIGPNGGPLGGTWDEYPPLHDAIDRAFAAWGQVIDVTFQKTGVGGVYNQSTADIAVILTGNELSESGAVAVGIFPDTIFADQIRQAAAADGTTYPNPEGDIAIDNYAFPIIAGGVGMGFAILLHEIGHALGLKHTWDDGGNGRPTLDGLGAAAYNSPYYTLFAPGVPDAYVIPPIPTTPLLLDIQAIQHIYGANSTYHLGDDRYIAAQGRNLTIWDAGGKDTLDFSSYTLPGIEFRLDPGTLVTLDSLTVVAIAYGVSIENVVGTFFNDTLYGNALDNEIDGGGGTDTLVGGPGDDVYVIYSAASSVQELVDQGTDTVRVRDYGTFGAYTLPEHVENLIVDAMNPLSGAQWRGNSSANSILGSRYAETLRGMDGDDTLIGDDGDDTLDGGPGADRLEGGAGNDRYIADALDIIVERPDGGIDLVEIDATYAAPDTIERIHLIGNSPIDAYGNALANELWGNSAANLLDGGDHGDLLFGFGGDDVLIGGRDNDHLVGGTGNDRLEGGDGDDLLEDEAGSNLLLGGSGNDRLVGGPGSDVFEGGEGDDAYWVNTGDSIHELADDGIDSVTSTGSFTLPDHVETLTFDGWHAFGIGNAANNIIIGRGTDSELYGNDGDDHLESQGSGSDRLFGGSGNDRLIANGSDLLQGGPGDDVYELTTRTEVLVEERLVIEGAPGSSLLDGQTLEFGDSELYVQLLGQFVPYGIQGHVRIGALTPWLFRFEAPDAANQLTEGVITRAYDPSISRFSIYEPTVVQMVPSGFDLWQLLESWGHFDVKELHYIPDPGRGWTLDQLDLQFELHIGPQDPPLSGRITYHTTYIPQINDEVLELPGQGSDTLIVDAPFSGSTTIDLGAINFEHATLRGNEKIDVIGESGRNTLIGNAADNRFTGAGGDDDMDGGPGFDTSVLAGSASQYALVEHEGVLRVIDRVHDRDGVDTLVHMEALHFSADGTSQSVAGADVFTPLEYIASYSDLMSGFSANPSLGYEHFLTTGRYEGRHASFHGLQYVASYTDLMDGFGPNIDMSTEHYIRAGRFEGRTVSFSGLEYIASYVDLMESLGADSDAGTAHYITTGRFQGRGVHFSALDYLASYDDLMDGYGANVEAGAAHYIETGRFETRHATFSGLEYLASHLDLMAGFGSNAHLATEHYITSGRSEGRHVTFDALQYIAAYADLLQGFGANVDSGATHYIAHGRFEDRTDRFDAAQYLANYADLQAGYNGDLRAATIHYIEHGFNEGRTDQPM